MNREPFELSVLGVDGVERVISGPGRGGAGVVLAPEASGLIDPPVSTIWKSGASQIGGDYQTLRYAARDLQLKVWVWDTPEADWQSVDSAWRRAWSYERDSTIIWRTKTSERRLKCRLSQTPEINMGQQGGHAGGHVEMLMHLRAGNPLWVEDSATDGWRFNGTNYLGSVTVANPTDMPMWLQFVTVGPASLIMPDYSHELREGWPGYEHRDRRLVLPFQSHHQDLLIDTNPAVEQIVSSDGSAFWARMNGQTFVYPVPAWTDPVEIPIVVNPIPWLPNLWLRLGIPFDIPVNALVRIAEVLTSLLAPLGDDTVLSWTPQRLAQEIDSAIRAVLPEFVGDWIDRLLQVLSIPTLGEIISDTWGSVANMAGAGVQVRMPMSWTRPYGMEAF